MHISKGSMMSKVKARKDLVTAIKQDCKEFGINAVQIFSHGPRGTSANHIDIGELNKHCEDTGTYLTIHSTYILGNTIWNVTKATLRNPNTKDKMKLHMAHFIDQLKTSIEMGRAPVVVHLPRRELSEVLETIKILAKFIIKYDAMILFENIPCNIKTKFEYSSAKSINEFVKEVVKLIPAENWGLCIDTAHIWSCGIDLSTYDAQDKWFNDLTKKASVMIKQFHLNGSEKKTFDSNRDVHFLVLSEADHIYHYNQKIDNKEEIKKLGIFSLCEFAKKNNVPIICEINSDRGSTTDEIKKSLKLIWSMLI